MTTRSTVEFSFHFARQGRGGRLELKEGQEPRPAPLEPGRVPRVSRLMALAIKFDRLLREGRVASFAELAELGQVSRARISQIMNLLNLAPDIQEAILHLPRTQSGRDALILGQLQTIANHKDWKRQREAWSKLRECASSGPPT